MPFFNQTPQKIKKEDCPHAIKKLEKNNDSYDIICMSCGLIRS